MPNDVFVDCMHRIVASSSARDVGDDGSHLLGVDEAVVPESDVFAGT